MKIVTNFENFSTPKRFLDFECIKPNDENNLSIPAELHTAVNNCIVNMLRSTDIKFLLNKALHHAIGLILLTVSGWNKYG